ncbi:calcium-binding protein [Loktanella salsilacus]|uniref:calcium-binding protein n=1 Tax=Loktanella salsilacus TaxID=195913 RepID=UPI0037354E06
MGELTRVASAARAQAADVSHLSDLVIVDGQLYATSRYDGALESWTISSNGLSLRDTQDHRGSLRPGDIGWITALDLNGGTQLLTGGGSSGGLVLRDPANTGALPGGTDLPDTMNIYGTLQNTSTIALSNGNIVVYGGLAGQDGLAQITLDGAGHVLSKRLVPDLNRTYAADITATATASIGGNTYLYTASATESGISAWSVAGNGNLVGRHDMGNADGLWVSNPTTLVSCTTGGRSFLVLASAGTDSLSVLRVEADGSLTIVDHLLDTRDTRFGSVTALEVVTHNGTVYVIAGGGDDGITVLQMLPDGQLVTRATIADTANMTLDNVSAITARGNGNVLDIFVTSASEDGITRLAYGIGPQGLTLTATGNGGMLQGSNGSDIITGLNGNDRLNGGSGDDIIRDGSGVDIVAGGAGADIFVMAADGTADTIWDFNPDEDRVDLSAWPFLRSIAQLTMTMTNTGFDITYGEEVLHVRAFDGRTIDHRTLTDDMLIGGARIPQVIIPGYAGPNLNIPTLTQGADTDWVMPPLPAPPSDPNMDFSDPDLGDPDGQSRSGNSAANQLQGGDGNDYLCGLDGDDRLVGGRGSDSLFGGAQNDVLLGGKGNDILDGGNQHDRLSGGKGDDRLSGGSGNDLLLGGTQNEKLFGNAGNDLLRGDTGKDQLFGGTGKDTFYGGKDDDRLIGAKHDDTLFGDNGNDKLFGGADNDWLSGGRNTDLVKGGVGDDILFGDHGNDRLGGQRGIDTLFGGTGGDRLYGGIDNDSLYGESGNDKIIAASGSDLLDGGDGVIFCAVVTAMIPCSAVAAMTA